MAGMLFIVSGPSGTGKGTMCKKVVAKTGIELAISATTRMPREGEVHEKDYFFLSENEFLKMVDEEGFLEHVENFGSRYGTPRHYVEKKLQEGKDVILEIDIQGAEKVKRIFPESICIFVLPPTLHELKQRIDARGTENQESISLRMGKAIHEIANIVYYDYYIINDNLEDAVEEMISIIRAERCRIKDSAEEILGRYKEEHRALSGD